MKKHTNIKAVIFIIGFFIIYSFSNIKNLERKISLLEIEILGKDPLLVSYKALKKRIKNKLSFTDSSRIGDISVREIEQEMKSHEFVKEVNVYMSIDGRLKIQVEQRKPILRVVDMPSYYIDEDGKPMPLSDVYSVRVPLFYDLDGARYKEVVPLIKYINQNSFYRMLVTTIERKQGNYFIGIRGRSFRVKVGSLENFKNKLKNFKIFYQLKEKNKNVGNYQLVNLEFNNQIVCDLKKSK